MQGEQSPNSINGNTIVIASVCSRRRRGVVFGEEKVRDPEHLEIVADHGAENLVILIATNNDNVAKQLTGGNGRGQVFEESVNRVTVIIVIVKVFTVLGANTKVTGCILSGAVDGVEAEMKAVGTSIACPTPPSQMGRIAARADSVGGSWASGKNGSATPLTQLRRGRSPIPCVNVFRGITIQPFVPADTLFPLAMWASTRKLIPSSC